MRTTLHWKVVMAAVVVGGCLIGRAALAAEATGWYPFSATSTPEAGEIGMQDWLDRPAGRHGRIVRQGDDLVYNGRPIKLWGRFSTSWR